MEADKFLGNGEGDAEDQDIFDFVPQGPSKFECKFLLLCRCFKNYLMGWTHFRRLCSIIISFVRIVNEFISNLNLLRCYKESCT